MATPFRSRSSPSLSPSGPRILLLCLRLAGELWPMAALANGSIGRSGQGIPPPSSVPGEVPSWLQLLLQAHLSLCSFSHRRAALPQCWVPHCTGTWGERSLTCPFALSHSENAQPRNPGTLLGSWVPCLLCRHHRDSVPCFCQFLGVS